LITWWKQPGNKTMKRQTKSQTRHIATDLAMFEIGLFKKVGYKVIDHGLKITAEKQ
jgi:hypothetical protein